MHIIYMIFSSLGAFILAVVFYKMGRWLLDKIGFKNKFNGRFSFIQISDFSVVFLIIILISIIGVFKNV